MKRPDLNREPDEPAPAPTLTPRVGLPFPDNEVTRTIRGNAQRLVVEGPENGPASADNEAFAWRLFALQATLDENTVMSPYSVTAAAAMLAAGAQGNTLRGIHQALSFSSEGEAFHAGQNRLLQALDSRNREYNREEGDEQFAQTLRVTNDLWLLDEFQPTDEYLNTLSTYYGAGVQLTRFGENPEAVRETINQKVANDTEGRIQEALPSGQPNADTVMVLTNSIYFKASWADPFAPLDTEPLPFETARGTVRDALMMKESFWARYTSNGEYSAVALPFAGEDLEFVAIMPASGTYEAFLGSLNATRIESIHNQLTRTYLELRFPKFEVESSIPLKQHLSALGMTEAFSPGVADFGIITSEIPLYVSEAYQKATIVLNEEGTEAAASTSALLSPASGRPPVTPATFDRAFVFVIRDVATEATLFVGQFVTPS